MVRATYDTAPPSRPGWRESRRPTNFGGQNRADDDTVEPPTMSRSRVQLATSYAPGVLMTWEGGKGICKSVPVVRDLVVEGTTRRLIFDSIREFVENWQTRALAARAAGEVPHILALDSAFFDARSGLVSIDPHYFQITDPGIIGYVPYPLVYQCGICGKVREFTSVEEQSRSPLPKRCGDHEARWAQIDVVYVHWSGGIEPLSPSSYTFDNASSEVRRIDVCKCGSRNFVLRNKAPIFSEWRFVCEDCGVPRELKKQDRDTWERLETDRLAGGRQYEFIEVNMLPVSYRANSAFYPQRSSFIEFRSSNVVDLLLESRRADLCRHIARIYGVPFAEPSDEEIKAALAAKDREAEWLEYVSVEAVAKGVEQRGQVERARKWRADLNAMRENWYDSGVIERGHVQSPALLHAVGARSAWAPRYDPIRLAIQHDVFVSEHIAERLPIHRAVDVLSPDIELSNVIGDPSALDRYRATIGGLLRAMGVDRLVLIRGLPLCEFSFGFSRVSPGPIYHRESQGRSVAMPVRLRPFDALPIRAGRKHPIYVTQQNNEALYFKLDERRVRRWLEVNGIPDLPPPDRSLGQAFIESYEDFGPFLDAFKDRERVGSTPRALPAYIYLLLHSLAHQLMHSLADVSGLDRDGLGEHIFPADLAFVLYRKGMTPDLGNVSAMWRNHASDFLKRALDPRMLRCGSGSLCDSRGGACPACIMISEVTCIASNQLLSRASLRGGPAPTWEVASTPPLVGYFGRALQA